MPWIWVLLPGHRGAGIHHDQRIGFFSCLLDVFIPLSSLAPPGAWEDPGGGSLDFFFRYKLKLGPEASWYGSCWFPSGDHSAPSLSRGKLGSRVLPPFNSPPLPRACLTALALSRPWAMPPGYLPLPCWENGFDVPELAKLFWGLRVSVFWVVSGNRLLSSSSAIPVW